MDKKEFDKAVIEESKERNKLDKKSMMVVITPAGPSMLQMI